MIINKHFNKKYIVPIDTWDQGPETSTRDQGQGTRGQGPGARGKGPEARDQGQGTRGKGPRLLMIKKLWLYLIPCLGKLAFFSLTFTSNIA
jgi:hypothetical protein